MQEHQLFNAIEKGDTNTVKELVRLEFTHQLRNSQGLTPLDLAAIKGHTDIARLLMEAGSQAFISDQSQASPFQYASSLHGPVANITVYIKFRSLYNKSKQDFFSLLSGCKPQLFKQVVINCDKAMMQYIYDQRELISSKVKYRSIKQWLNQSFPYIAFAKLKKGLYSQTHVKKGDSNHYEPNFKSGLGKIAVSTNPSNVANDLAVILDEFSYMGAHFLIDLLGSELESCNQVALSRILDQFAHSKGIQFSSYSDTANNSLLHLCAKNCHIYLSQYFLQAGTPLEKINTTGITAIQIAHQSSHEILLKLFSLVNALDSTEQKNSSNLSQGNIVSAEKENFYSLYQQHFGEISFLSCAGDLLQRYTKLSKAGQLTFWSTLAFNYYELDPELCGTLIELIFQSSNHLEIETLLTTKNNQGDALIHLLARHPEFTTLFAPFCKPELAHIFSLLNVNNLTPLAIAAEYGNDNAVKTLLALDSIAIDGASDAKRTPLALAMYQGHVECALHLIEHGARLTNIDEEGNSALHLLKPYSQRQGNSHLITLIAKIIARENSDITSYNQAGMLAADLLHQVQIDLADIYRQLKKVTRLQAAIIVGDLAQAQALCVTANAKKNPHNSDIIAFAQQHAPERIRTKLLPVLHQHFKFSLVKRVTTALQTHSKPISIASMSVGIALTYQYGLLSPWGLAGLTSIASSVSILSNQAAQLIKSTAAPLVNACSRLVNATSQFLKQGENTLIAAQDRVQQMNPDCIVRLDSLALNLKPNRVEHTGTAINLTKPDRPAITVGEVRGSMMSQRINN